MVAQLHDIMETMIPSLRGLRPHARRVVAGHRPVTLGVIAALIAICQLAILAGPATAAPVPTGVPASQELVVLLAAADAHRAPEATSPQMEVVQARRPITGEETTLPVLSLRIGLGGVRWLLVMLPGRPNGSTGWIPQLDNRLIATPWRIKVDLAARRVSVYRDGRLTRVFEAVVGKPSTPTPSGRFFVEESVQMAPGQAGAPFALALSARSNALQEFEGGPGQIAIHGRENIGGTVGRAESHGCIRLATASIDWLAERIRPGTPVTIEAA